MSRKTPSFADWPFRVRPWTACSSGDYCREMTKHGLTAPPGTTTISIQVCYPKLLELNSHFSGIQQPHSNYIIIIWSNLIEFTVDLMTEKQSLLSGFPVSGLGQCVVLDTQGTSGEWMNVDCNNTVAVACERQRELQHPFLLSFLPRRFSSSVKKIIQRTSQRLCARLSRQRRDNSCVLIDYKTWINESGCITRFSIRCLDTLWLHADGRCGKKVQMEVVICLM